MTLDTAQIVQQLIKERGIQGADDHARRLLGSIKVQTPLVYLETP